MSGTLTGTATLIRFALRRDRIRLPVWIAAIALFVVGTALSLPDLYVDANDRQLRAEVILSPAARAFAGPGIGVDDYTFGAMLTNEMLGFTAVAAALMSVLLMVRHTRTEEETGRSELIRANVTGRHAQLAAALAVAVLANVALAVVIAVGLGSAGIESVGWAGSWLFGAVVAAVGLVFAGVTALTAQVTEHARGAAGMAGLALGAAYALRAVGDLGNDALSWLSPIGWAQRSYPYVDDRWWPLLLVALPVTVLLAAAAVQLSSRRDVGAGLVPQRPGPATASERLSSPWALAWRLQRAGFIGWSLALLVFGALYGTMLGEVEGFLSEISAVEEMLATLGDEITDAFLALLVSVLAMIAAIQALLATLRARSEEVVGRAEPVLATASSRSRWLASYWAVAAAGGTVSLLAGTFGIGLTGAIALDDASVLPTVLGAALVYVAPLLLTIGAGIALFGLVPAVTGVAWLVVVYAIFTGLLGGLLGMPDWAIELSPFAAVPMLPADDLTAGPILVVLLLAVALTAAGFAGFRRRDLYTTA